MADQNNDEARTRFWTPRMLAALWQVSVRTVLREIQRGNLVGHKFGALWRVSDADRLQYEGSQRCRRSSSGG